MIFSLFIYNARRGRRGGGQSFHHSVIWKKYYSPGRHAADHAHSSRVAVAVVAPNREHHLTSPRAPRAHQATPTTNHGAHHHHEDHPRCRCRRGGLRQQRGGRPPLRGPLRRRHVVVLLARGTCAMASVRAKSKRPPPRVLADVFFLSQTPLPNPCRTPSHPARR